MILVLVQIWWVSLLTEWCQTGYTAVATQPTIISISKCIINYLYRHLSSHWLSSCAVSGSLSLSLSFPLAHSYISLIPSHAWIPLNEHSTVNQLFLHGTCSKRMSKGGINITRTSLCARNIQHSLFRRIVASCKKKLFFTFFASDVSPQRTNIACIDAGYKYTLYSTSFAMKAALHINTDQMT